VDPAVTRRRILYLGQKPVGEAAWARLRTREREGFRVVAVCSNADAERVWWRSNEVFRTRGPLPFVDNAERNEDELAAAMDDLAVNTIVCVHHPWILSGGLLERVGREAYTFHSAKLPDYRGFNAVNHALLNGDLAFTCTAHRMAREVDAGAILLEARFPIAADETALSLYAKAQQATLLIFDELVGRLLDARPFRERPVLGAGTFYPRSSIEGLREIRQPSESERKARAFYFPPFEPAYVVEDGRKRHVLPAEAAPELDPDAVEVTG
jgi:methionyl-tRNA formyltransferase